jgi:hypothetical protein
MPSSKGDNMGNRNNLGGDPSQWSNSRMTGVGLSIAGGVAGAMTSVLVNAAQARKRQQRGVSAKQMRMTAEEVHALELHLSSMLLKYRIAQVGERDREIAELKRDLAAERYRNSR